MKLHKNNHKVAVFKKRGAKGYWNNKVKRLKKARSWKNVKNKR